jgi:hypothetical protein
VWREIKAFERSKQEIAYRKWPKMWVPVACRCDAHEYAHIHEDDPRKWEVIDER